MDVVLRSAAVFVFLWFATRAMGKRELAEMSPFDLILLVIMGDLVQQGITGDDRSVTGAILAVATMTVLVITLGFVTYRSKRAREIVDGLPLVVIRDGRPLDDLMKYERLTTDELQTQARNIGVDDLKKVRVAILEPEGQFSFVLYDDHPNGQQRRKQSNQPKAE
jgi:uncharacterized membrane protein YcaP (DUF421 family)